MIKRIVLILALSILPHTAAQAITTIQIGPYLQRVSAHAATILLRTDLATTVTIHYRKVGADHWKTSPSASASTEHRFRLTSLKKGQAYEYYLSENDDRLTMTYQFSTEKNITKADPLKLAVFGDSGRNTTDQYAVASQIMRWQPDMILHTGDIAYYSGTTEEFISNFFEPYQALLPEVPFYLSPGNHDYITDQAGPYKDFFEMPTAGGPSEDYYSFNYDSIHIVSLNSNLDYSVGSAMYNWLASDLTAAVTQPWIIVFFHHPPYSSGEHGSTIDMQTTIVPLFEQYGVDVVLNGHDHDYERTATINGVRYIVTGGGGHDSLYGQTNLELNPYSEKFEAVYHFLAITARYKKIKIEAINTQGYIVDTVNLSRE
ncbi:MAG: metallophosphoesterase [Candidatus Kerfeldbacteria bacterium]|nr:metallophosphoesterase [Candidatus Kerfeldbacteria bacterium]